MKKCERCELNYINEDDKLCEICATENLQSDKQSANKHYSIRINNKNKYTVLPEKTPVSMREINNGINAVQVFRAVKNLIGENVYEKDLREIYNLSEYSYRRIMNKLKASVKYAELRIGVSRHLSEYRFDGDEVFEKFFMKDPKLAEGIKYRRIRNVYDLLNY